MNRGSEKSTTTEGDFGTRLRDGKNGRKTCGFDDAPSWSFTRGCEAWLSTSIWMLDARTGPAANLMGSTRERWSLWTSMMELDEKYVVSSERLVSTSRSMAIGYIP